LTGDHGLIRIRSWGDGSVVCSVHGWGGSGFADALVISRQALQHLDAEVRTDWLGYVRIIADPDVADGLAAAVAANLETAVKAGGGDGRTVR